MLMLLRQEVLDRQGIWGISEPPYTEWTLRKVGFQVGGPNFIALNDSTIVAGSRSCLIPGSFKTMLLKGEVDGRFEQIAVLPYTNMEIRDDFALRNIAFRQKAYKVDKDLNVLD